MSWLVDLSVASEEAMLAARALLIDPDAPAGTRYVGGLRWVTPARELVDQVAAVCPEALIEDRGAETVMTAGGGAYRPDEDGVWRCTATGEPVPGAEDLTLRDLHPDPEIVGFGDQAVMLVPDALVRESDDLAWVREVASGPTSRYDSGTPAPSSRTASLPPSCKLSRSWICTASPTASTWPVRPPATTTPAPSCPPPSTRRRLTAVGPPRHRPVAAAAARPRPPQTRQLRTLPSPTPTTRSQTTPPPTPPNCRSGRRQEPTAPKAAQGQPTRHR